MKKFFIFLLLCVFTVSIMVAFSLTNSLIKSGEKYVKEKNFIKAQKVFSTITVLDPENNTVRSKLIQVFLKTKDFNKALREVQMALSFENNNKEFLKLKDELENKVKLEENPKKAVEKIQIIKFKLPKFISATNLLKLKSKTTHLGISKKNLKNFDMAHSYYEKQKYKKAIEFFEIIIKSDADKDNLSVNQFAGESYFWIGNYDKAITLLNKVVKFELKNIEAKIILSYAYMAIKKPDYIKALKFLNEVLKIKNNNIPALVGTGICHLKTGNDNKAEIIFNMVIKLVPTELKAYYGLSEIYLKKKLYDKAMSYLHTALGFVPESYETIEKIGDIYVKMKIYNTAAYIYRKAMDFSPANPDLYGKFCITLLLSKQNFTAGLYLAKARNLDPENKEIHFAYGMFWEANINFEKAVNAYKKTLSIDHQHLDAKFYLIKILMGNSNIFPNAAKIYKNRISQVTNMILAEKHIKELYAIDKENIYKEELKEFENIIFNLKADIEEKELFFNEMYDIKIKTNH